MTRIWAMVLLWLIRRSSNRHWPTPVVTMQGVLLFKRYEPFAPDEWRGRARPPWWRPFNALLHRWVHGEAGAFHDHPRWSITICLRGRIIERTPWGERLLRPGSIVLRSRKFIHAFEIPPGFAGKTWTLFIVGRRNHRQNSFEVTPRRPKTSGLPPWMDEEI